MSRENRSDLEPSDVAMELSSLERNLDIMLETCMEKIESGRVYDPTNERVRIKWIRAAKDVCAEKRKTVESRSLVEMSNRLEEIEAETGIEVWER